MKPSIASRSLASFTYGRASVKPSTNISSPMGSTRLNEEMKCEATGSFGIQCSGASLTSKWTLRACSASSSEDVVFGAGCVAVIECSVLIVVGLSEGGFGGGQAPERRGEPAEPIL